MKDLKRLPDAELEVMQAIWSLEPPVTAAEVQQQVSRDWKATSVLTFLARLCDKGFLACEKEGRQNYYTPLIAREAYLQRRAPALSSGCAAARSRTWSPACRTRRADRAGHRRPARFSGRAGTVGWEG